MSEELLKRLEAFAARLEDLEPGELALQAVLPADDELKWLVERVALVHWFDRALVDALLPESLRPETFVRDSDYILGQPVDYFEELTGLAIVEPLPHLAGEKKSQARYAIRRAYREQLLRRWQAPERRAELVAASRTLRDAFRQRSQKKGVSELEQPIFTREALYHQFIADEDGALAEFRRLFDEAQAGYQFGVCQVLVNLAREQQPFFQRPLTSAWLLYYQGRLSLLLGDGRAAQESFTATLKYPRLARSLNGRAHAGLGDAARASGDWTRAIDEYEISLDILLDLRAYRVSETIFNQLSLLADFFYSGPVRRWLLRPLLEGGRWSVASGARRLEINDKVVKAPERLEVARILTSMAELALAMSQPALRITPALEAMKWSARLAAQATPTPDGKPLSLWQRYRAFSKAADERTKRESELREQSGLVSLVHFRLLDFAADFYQQAKRALELPQPESQEKPAPGEQARPQTSRPGQQNLAWDIQYGLARVALLRIQGAASSGAVSEGSVAPVAALFEALQSEQLSRRDQAQLLLALGDCSLAARKPAAAIERFRQVTSLLEGSWDQGTLAKAYLRLGYAHALLEEWQPAIEHLTRSRALSAELKNPRQEEAAQELLREIARLEYAPPPDRQTAQEQTRTWSRHYFAYSSSSQVMRRVMGVWFPVLVVASLGLAIPYFFFLRWLGMAIFGLFAAKEIFSAWWVNLALAGFTWLGMLQAVDSSYRLRRWVARLLPLDAIWGTQPGIIRLDEQGLTEIDYTGQARLIPWEDVRQVRHAFSKDWISAEASLLASGKPGGRTLVLGRQGALVFDAGINSYFELDQMVQERVPAEVQQRREFQASFRSFSGTLGLGLLSLILVYGCIAAFVFSIQNPAWWVAAIKIIVGVFFALSGLGIGFVILSHLTDAFRLARFAFPRHLKPPDALPSVDYNIHYLEEEKRSL